MEETLNYIHQTTIILGSLCKLCSWCASLLELRNKTSICLNCYSENPESSSLPYSELRNEKTKLNENLRHTNQICCRLLYYLNNSSDIQLIDDVGDEAPMMHYNLGVIFWYVDNNGNYFQPIRCIVVPSHQHFSMLICHYISTNGL